jgi:alkylhydroperoxidase family enzyme
VAPLTGAHIEEYLMPTYCIHTIDSAPAASRGALSKLTEIFGFTPNLAGLMATSPVLIQSFIGLFQRVHAGSFSEAEIQTLLLTNAVSNACEWAVALHSALALKEGLAAADVGAMRERRLPADPRHAALSVLTRTLVEQRGRIADGEMDSFRAAGFGADQVLEVIAVLAASTMTNYAGNVGEPPLEAFLHEHAWSANAASGRAVSRAAG